MPGSQTIFSMDHDKTLHTARIPPSAVGRRLDQVLAELVPD